jgi:hypothetical protein
VSVINNALFKLLFLSVVKLVLLFDANETLFVLLKYELSKSNSAIVALLYGDTVSKVIDLIAEVSFGASAPLVIVL